MTMTLFSGMLGRRICSVHAAKTAVSTEQDTRPIATQVDFIKAPMALVLPLAPQSCLA